MRRLRARRMSGAEAARFRNLVREVLGLTPIPVPGREQRSEAEQGWQAHLYASQTSAIAAFGGADGMRPRRGSQ